MYMHILNVTSSLLRQSLHQDGVKSTSLMCPWRREKAHLSWEKAHRSVKNKWPFIMDECSKIVYL